MPKNIARTEELPVLPLTGAMAPTSVTAQQNLIYPGNLHPRMMLVRLGVTGLVAGA